MEKQLKNNLYDLADNIADKGKMYSFLAGELSLSTNSVKTYFNKKNFPEVHRDRAIQLLQKLTKKQLENIYQ